MQRGNDTKLLPFFGSSVCGFFANHLEHEGIMFGSFTQPPRPPELPLFHRLKPEALDNAMRKYDARFEEYRQASTQHDRFVKRIMWTMLFLSAVLPLTLMSAALYLVDWG